jgi:hypothetical protein
MVGSTEKHSAAETAEKSVRTMAANLARTKVAGMAARWDRKSAALTVDMLAKPSADRREHPLGQR